MRLCVFCGSSGGNDPRFAQAAIDLGTLMAQRRIGIVYGGGRVGLMGLLADAARAAGGEVIGIIPQALAEREIAHSGLTELRIVDSMHERKALMGDLSDGFVALPGGFGTLEEFCEVITWSQLGIHSKPCGILNVAGYFNHLIAMFDYAVSQGFITVEKRGIVLEAERPEEIIERMTSVLL
ncbi:MAG: TIGR00730 family Rossman fold protein [Vulcanimicrobiaceae bacterium]